jgi:ribosomal protein S12 methylthiotransferase
VGDIRSKLPKLSLRTTFIVGFPGESDKQFQNLLSFVNEGLFNYLGSFTYSREENTPAAIRMDQVPDDVKQERQTALTEAHYNVAHKQGLSRIGTVETVVLEETEGEDILARSRYEAPDIDAIIRLPQKAARGGQFIKAKITGYDSYEFTGEPV